MAPAISAVASTVPHKEGFDSHPGLLGSVLGHPKSSLGRNASVESIGAGVTAETLLEISDALGAREFAPGFSPSRMHTQTSSQDFARLIGRI